MTLEEFANKKWQHSEHIEFHNPNRENTVVDCMLLAVDFEQSLFKLIPFDSDMYEDQSFWCRVEYCKRPRPKPKLAK